MALILIVDDRPENRLLLASQVRTRNYEVVEASNGVEGIELTKSLLPDLVLLDVMMPKMNGWEVCKTLKSDPVTANIPIIMVTALRDIRDKIKGIEAGADEFLSRPHHREELLLRVAKLIDKRRQTLELVRELEELKRSATVINSIKTKGTSVDFSRQDLSYIPDQVFSQLHIEELILADNLLVTIPSKIARLNSLRRLDISNNRLQSLPRELLLLPHLDFLNILGNDLDIPEDIAKLTDHPQRILRAYFKHVATTENTVNIEGKIILIGDAGVGKTSLVKALTGEPLRFDEEVTIGVQTISVSDEIIDRVYQLNYWDFGGQEFFHDVHQLFMTDNCVYIVVLDARQSILEKRLEYWVKQIEVFSNNPQVIVVINKTDLQKVEISQRQLRVSFPIIRSLAFTSCKTNEGIQQLKESIAESISGLPNSRLLWSASWSYIRDFIISSNANYLSIDRFASQCQLVEITEQDEIDLLLNTLNEYGLILTFRDNIALNATSILNPDWIAKGIYGILNSTMIRERAGLLDTRDLQSILDQKYYPRDTHRFMIDILLHFGLISKMKREETLFLVPTKLPAEQPDLPFNTDDLPLFEYRFNYLNQSLINQIIVELHPFADDNGLWNGGIVISVEKSQAILIANTGDKKIGIWANKNGQSNRVIVAIIRNLLLNIFTKVPHLTFEEAFPIPGYREDFITYEELLNLEHKGIKSYFVAKINDEIDVSNLLGRLSEPENRDLSSIRLRLQKVLSISELKNLCFDIELDYETLAAQNKSDLVRELLIEAKNRGMIGEVLRWCAKYRPDVEW